MNLFASNFFLEFTLDKNNALVLTDEAKKDFIDTEEEALPKVSEASRRLRDEVIRVTFPDIEDLDEDSLVQLVKDTDLKVMHNGIYQLIEATLLETYTLNYILGQDKDYIVDLTSKDISRLRKNFNFLCTWLADYRKYRYLIQYFRHLDLAVGYTENQLNYILESTNLAESRYRLNY